MGGPEGHVYQLVEALVEARFPFFLAGEGAGSQVGEWSELKLGVPQGEVGHIILEQISRT